MNKLVMKLFLLVMAGAFALMPGAWADEWNQKTVFTFSAPVEIPGQVLPAGTYVFKLANSAASRHIVQVFNADETRVFGTFLAIPDYHLRPAEEPIIHFHERPAGSPDAIKGWVYPGRTFGHEFVYPKTEARVLAMANHTPVPAMPVELEKDTVEPTVTLSSPEVRELTAAPLVAEKADGEEAPIAEVFMIAEPQASEAPAELPSELPETATQLPLIGAAGALGLLAAGATRLLAKSE
jgi:hypothetical protein